MTCNKHSLDQTVQLQEQLHSLFHKTLSSSPTAGACCARKLIRLQNYLRKAQREVKTEADLAVYLQKLELWYLEILGSWEKGQKQAIEEFRIPKC